MWDDLRFNIINHIKRKFSISIQINLPSNSHRTSWWLSTIYGLASRRNRAEFFDEVEDLKFVCLPNWLLGGDFNVIRWNLETSTKHLAQYNLKKFNAFIESINLIELPLTNAKYTWSNMRNQSTLSKLDKFFPSC